MQKVFEIYIKTTPEKLWNAITDTEMRSKYTFGAVVTSDWTQGSSYASKGNEGGLIFEGENLEVDPPRLLVQSFRRYGARMSGARAPRASPGRSNRSATRAC
jgi:uncharacterized protein YndB with AHSA1/START domain